MQKETCFGVVPIRIKGTDWEVLLIKHNKGHWGFPKGHPMDDETPYHTAERELFEETGLSIVKLVDKTSLKEVYTFETGQEKIDKTVFYYIAEITGEIHLLQEEIAEFRWVSFEEAFRLITFDQSRKICQQTKQILETIL